MGRVGIRPTLFKLMAGRDHPEFSGKSQQVREQSEKVCTHLFNFDDSLVLFFEFSKLLV